MQKPGDEFSFLKRTYVWVDEGLLVKLARNLRDSGGGRVQFDLSKGRSGVSIHRWNGRFLSQERLDISLVIKELASKMSSPTERSLQHMRRMVGYLKETEGQHVLLAMNDDGSGSQAKGQKKWLLETFNDADWSVCKATRRSTSGAVHAVNGVIAHTSSRSLSSAESELNALLSGARDGIWIRYALEFLTGQEIQHICWVGNSATRQVACKRGSGRLRHVNGRSLWCQVKMAEGSLGLKQISTTVNLADIGTKPLSRNRLQLLLFWRNAREGHGGRVWEKEHETDVAEHVEKGKFMKIAKYLNRLILVGGLELPLASRPVMELEKATSSMKECGCSRDTQCSRIHVQESCTPKLIAFFSLPTGFE